jgi:hypothetical protein
MSAARHTGPMAGKEAKMSRNSPTSSPLLVDEREAARLLNISPRKMWQLAASGAIPIVRIDSCKRYDLLDLQSYINAQKSGGEA